MNTEPIAAPATPLLPSAVAILRVSGPDLASRLSPLLHLPAPQRAALRRLRWSGPQGAFNEQALVLFFPAPHSYTGEDVVELQIHGNPLLARRLLDHLGALGIRLAEPGEFTRRALLNGKQGLLEAEALRDLVDASTDQQLRQAQARQGGIPEWLSRARNRLAPWIARAEAAVDYGEEEGLTLDLAALKNEAQELGSMFHVEQVRSAAARWLRDGIRVVLVGRPNAGKSTLFNALAEEDRAIVTSQPGTTRDVLEVRTEWRGLPLLLFDTAGIRATDGEVEILGIARIQGLLERADLVLHLIPATDAGPDPEVLAMLGGLGAKTLEVRTLADLAPGAGLRVSAATGDLSDLEQALIQRFLGNQAPEALLGALATARQLRILDALLEQVDLVLQLREGAPPEMAASLLQGAWSLLLRLTGEDRAETSLDELFSGFCLGK
ncbi:MAG TPA: tRNA modification GTPase [Holophagaceae bacterium]|nr:tRNA modification GTPase [Holophagaceae bacterium]